ncbi:response regulator transcription factor [Brevundimonas poindexterae]|uniref:response regulator transcription factor n=1 Tax=Brevundimonas poindexterae TaxID=74325 RepID=UPI001CFE40EC|nr:response regulator [Brevundimonas poindexterae]
MTPNEEPSTAAAVRSVAIVDDDPFMLEYLSLALGKTPYRIAVFESAEAFLDNVVNLPPGIVLTDLKMPGMDGMALLKALQDRALESRPTVIMSAFADIPLAVLAMKTGAVSVLQKPIMPAALLQAVEDAMATLAEEDTGWKAVRLTNRERQVADLIAEGLTSKEIALRLGISYRTVEVFRSSILRKTNTNNVAALVALIRGGS